jgi:predicted MFS family arabinose efflux permease
VKLDRGLLGLLSLIAAVSVGNLYLAQPLLVEMGRAFAVTPTSVGAVVTLGQVGYGTGVLLLVPLGDLLDRRRLILALLGGVVLALLCCGTAPTLGALCAASLGVGLCTVIPQVVVPYAASLAPDDQRASVLGTVQGALLVGILLSRTLSGGLATWVGWRGVYFAAALVCVALAAAVAARFPRQPTGVTLSYRGALASMLALAGEPVLLRVSLASGLNFAVFTGFWTALPFLLQARYGQGTAAAGAFGLLGAAGAILARYVGRLADRRGTHFTQLISAAATLASFGAFVLGERGLGWLMLGVVVMDAAVQGVHIACQVEAFTVAPSARSRVNGVYMFIRFAGGALGSAVGAACWGRWGWAGVCASGAACALASLVPILRQPAR